NLTMREFEEIGRVVHDFASEDATVVVGTSLDPELQDEVRVTVVATGLNRAAATRQPLRHGAKHSEGIEPRARPRPRPVVLRTGTGNEAVDYASPVESAAPQTRSERVAAASADTSIDILDIPAFLRHQAD
ncbi:MAG TPA: cell division protein FtsZ, partial [Oleiagrimonas sp.]|nr:cell division protein FtsZ [Oleiagrimonas sp.]